MNQILEYGTGRKNNGSAGSDNIIRIFAILLIALAIGLVCVLIYGKVSNNEDVKTEISENTKANIEVNVIGDSATISITHDKNIEKVVYSWNSSNEKTIKINAQTCEEKIDIPTGNNTLHVKVIDEVGEETTLDKEIEIEQGIDIINPIIDMSIENSKLKIVATDETELSFITYRWNDEEETKIEVSEDKKRIETEIEILKESNDLTIIAVDASNNTTTETKSFIGRTKPSISVTLSADGSSISIKATDEYGMESVQFNFNDVDYNVDIGDGNPKDIAFDQKLVVGENRIILTVTNIYGIKNQFDGKCNYGENEEQVIENLSEDNSNIEAEETSNE